MLIVFGTKIENHFGMRNLFILFGNYMQSVVELHKQINQMFLVKQAFGAYFPIPPIDFYEQSEMFTEYGRGCSTTFNRITIGISAGVFGIMLAYTTLFPTHPALGYLGLKPNIPRFLTSIFIIGEIIC